MPLPLSSPTTSTAPTIRKTAPDEHYVSVGRWCTVLGVLISIGTAYLVMQFASIMDYVQALFSFFIAPLFGTVIFGMLWKRTTPARRFLGSALWNAQFHRHVGLGQARSVGARLYRHLAPRQGYGGKHVPRAMVMDHLQCRHRPLSAS